MYCLRMPGKSEGIWMGWFPRATVLLPGMASLHWLSQARTRSAAALSPVALTGPGRNPGHQGNQQGKQPKPE